MAAQFVNRVTKCPPERKNLDNRKISKVIDKIKQAGTHWKMPAVIHIGQEKDPFRVLVSCILSLRTRDEVTAGASKRLFALADTPQKLLSLVSREQILSYSPLTCAQEPLVARVGYRQLPLRRGVEARRKNLEGNQKTLHDVSNLPLAGASALCGGIEKAIYPVAFYRKKAQTLVDICRKLIAHYGAKVPDTLDELLKLKGVGRKTANLTLILGYGKMGICVDTHVHRISNRWGYVKTRSPDATEMALRNKLPKKYWMQYNDLLVSFGQNCCKPISPLCSQCCVSDPCEKIGIGDKHR